MAVNADDIRPEELEDGVHEPNSYYKAFDAIVAGLLAPASPPCGTFVSVV